MNGLAFLPRTDEPTLFITVVPWGSDEVTLRYCESCSQDTEMYIYHA